jgi:hypothetical protein
MDALRKLASIVLCLVAIICLLLGVSVTPDSWIESTIENGRAIEQSFRLAVSHIEEFRKKNARLPTPGEYQNWAKVTPNLGMAGQMDLVIDQFPREGIEEFGNPTAGAYLLKYWRGDWYEYYASWSGRSSIALDKEAFYAFGNRYVDIAVFLALSVLGIFVAIKMWPNRPMDPTR